MKTMLNFRKLRQDFTPAILKSGKEAFQEGTIQVAKIILMDSSTIKISAQIKGKFGHNYESEIEIDRLDSNTMDSNCDCSYQYDCLHLAALLFYLEDNLDRMLVEYSKQTDLDEIIVDAEEKKALKAAFDTALTKENRRNDAEVQKLALQEYISASHLLTKSPFFLPEQKITEDKADIAIIFSKATEQSDVRSFYSHPEIQFVLRLPGRSKPLYVPSAQEFLDAIKYKETLQIGGRRYFFNQMSFSEESYSLLKLIASHVSSRNDTEVAQRHGKIDLDTLGNLLAQAYEFAIEKMSLQGLTAHPGEYLSLPYLYHNSLEEPVVFSTIPCTLCVHLNYLEVPTPKLLLKPTIQLDKGAISPEEALLLECATPGLIYKNVYYRFPTEIKRTHLRQLPLLRDITIPEPLFGTFIENALPELQRFAQVTQLECIENFVTIPFANPVKARCDIQYLHDEIEASLTFIYDTIEISAHPFKLNYGHLSQFISEEGILARNLTEEREIIQTLFQDFIIDPKSGHFIAKSEKKVVEFMTETIPQNQNRIIFNCPDILLNQFIYEKTHFKVHLKQSDLVDSYTVELSVDGHLEGIKLDSLWDCLASKRSHIEMEEKKKKSRKQPSTLAARKILVLDLHKLGRLIPILDELGITRLEKCEETRPLWSLACIDPSSFEDLPIEFSMDEPLKEIQAQIQGVKPLDNSPIPEVINATLRPYQVDGVQWLERLRKMHLNGILADDMGLGKTLQAIAALTQYHTLHPNSLSLIVAPTSLLYNWKEEISKFNPNLYTVIIDGTPSNRKKRLEQLDQADIVITSYGLLQKDVDTYKKMTFAYTILDEAQHIKNRGTRNAKSAKMVNSKYKLILTGTPIENSLEELWSLFDFLMPGLLSTYERFVEKYIRIPFAAQHNASLPILRKKTAPFILRRMKKDVLKDLPPISHIVYHCHLSDVQKSLYQEYAASARKELQKLVQKEGFEKAHIHILATLTRLKQICCHPAIFAKDQAEIGDSAKYDMLLDVLTSLVEGQHKTVIFSQYTRMLRIMRADLEQMGIKFVYLDGSTKNRLEIVEQFNQDATISVFLVSLKAGGTGLNLTGADTVIHYDMWWNPAVENQATDRVYRLGQDKPVSSCKLITLDTIEEKILNLQNRKSGLADKVISDDDEITSKLTWEEVLELLQT